MAGLGKHVEGLQALQRVTVVGKEAAIPSLGGGMTGNIDDPLWFQNQDGRKKIVSSPPGRVDDEDIKRTPSIYELSFHDPSHIAVKKNSVSITRPGQIVAGAGYRFSP